MAKRKIIVLLLAATVGVLVLAAKVAQPGVWERRLVAACQGADRIVVDLNTGPSGRGKDAVPTFRAIEITASDAVGGLLEAVQLKTNWLNSSCRCFGDLQFRVYRRQELLPTLTLHHDKNLRWNDGKWFGDGRLTAQGRSALQRWLIGNDCPTGEEARAEKTVAWDAFRAKTREVAENP